MFSILGEAPLFTINLGNIHLVLYQIDVLYLIIAVVVSLITEFIFGWRSVSIIGAIIAALIGIWVVTRVITLVIPGDINFFGIQLFKTLVGAFLFAALWYLLTSRVWPRRRLYTQGPTTT